MSSVSPSWGLPGLCLRGLGDAEPQALPACPAWSPLPSCCQAGYSQGGNGPLEATPSPLESRATSCPTWALVLPFILPAQARPRLPAQEHVRPETSQPHPAWQAAQVPENLHLGPLLQTPPVWHHLLPPQPMSMGEGRRGISGIPGLSMEADSYISITLPTAVADHLAPTGLALNQRTSLDPKGPMVKVTTLLHRQPRLQERSLLGLALPFRPGPSPTRSSHPIQWGFLPLSTPDQGRSPSHPTPRSTLGNAAGGL